MYKKRAARVYYLTYMIHAFFIQEINSLARLVRQFFALTTTAPFGRNWIEK